MGKEISDVVVSKVTDANDVRVYERVRDLLHQLYTNQVVPQERFQRVVSDSATEVFIAEVDGTIVGTASLSSYDKLGGVKVCVIEDVVVDESLRGGGIGKKLTDALVQRAVELGAPFVDVSTRREDAMEFYVKNGFEDKSAKKHCYTLRRYLKK